MKNLTMSEYRRLKGVTITELAEITGISEHRVSGLEEYRRRMTEDEAIKLTNFLGCTVEELLEDNQRFATNDYVLEQWRKHGQVPYLSAMNAETIINVLTDICHYIYSDFSISSRDSAEDIECELMNHLIQSRILRSEHDEKTFITTLTSQGETCTSWITLYEPPRFDKLTIVFEHVAGRTFSNDAEWIIPKFIEQWTNMSPNVKRRGRSFEEIRFLELTNSSGKSAYTEVQLVDGSATTMPYKFISPKIEETVYRTYRKTIPSSELPDPVFRDIGDYRCGDSRVGDCPHNTKQQPSESNGCLDCRRTALTWQARMWLLKHLTDVELYRIDGFFDFEQTYPTIHNGFVQEFEPLCKELNDDCLRLFSRVKNWMGFTINSSPIHIEGDNYTNGRHRASIAKTLGIESVPIIYTSTKRENDYLVYD